jgi:tRNA A37 threonylcarbamoyladenosine synthetase subunit TsaC/SUA5/YrdC
MGVIIRPAHPVASTGDFISPEQVAADGAKIIDCVYGGGVAIIGLDVAYAIIGCHEVAIRRIFAAKQRSYEKPSGLFANTQISDEVHVLPEEKRVVIREMIAREKLPFSVVAPFRADHPFFSKVDPFVIQNSTKGKTIDMLLNAGVLHDEIARRAWAAGQPVFGSSANTSLMGSKYRTDDIEQGVLDAADLVVDYGQSKFANPLGRSSTIIDFSDFSVIRIGVIFDQLKAAFDRHFGIQLKTPITP